MNERIRRRSIEKHCSASIRAISKQPRAEFRRRNLFLKGKRSSFHVPHLVTDVLVDPIDQCRGVTDAMALRLRHSDPDIHRSLIPEDGISKLVFDILEQLRCESIVDDNQVGIARNIEVAFSRWTRRCHENRLVENEVGLLIYSIAQIVRSRLNNKEMDSEVNCHIESVRFQLDPLIGSDLGKLYPCRKKQRKYANHAKAIAEVIGAICRSLGSEFLEKQIVILRSRNLLPGIAKNESYLESEDANADRLDWDANDASVYRVFCKDFDKQVYGYELYRLEQRRELRAKLDRMITSQAISIPRLAQKLKLLFSIPRRSGWSDGEEEGYIDGRRLSQIVSRPGYSRVFKQEKHEPWCDTVVSFLIDNSGSMKRQRFEAVTILVDCFCRALELAGVTTEILGFTTRGWAGGQSIKLWRDQGAPESPGRLNDQMHIVYKGAETSWRRQRYSICSLMNPIHFREGLDGEALQWAASRLRNRVEARKCLIMISDGTPMDSATSNYNDEFYLGRHFENVVKNIERSSDVELKAIAVGLDMDNIFTDSISLDLTGTISNRGFNALDALFSKS